MPVRFAVATGNWSNTAIWDNGALPVSGDTVYPNNYTVTLDQDIDIASLNNNLSPVYLPNMAIPLMTSLNQPNGVAFGNGNTAGFDASKAFDQNTSTYYSSSTAAGFVGYQFPTSKIIKQYRFIPLTNFQARDWTFQGSNDGINYTTLHTVASYASGTYNSGVISNTTSYIYYRINVTATTNGNGCNFTSVEMTESTGLVYASSSGGSFTVPASLSGTRNIVQTGDGIKSNNAATVMTLAHTSGNTVNFNISGDGYIFNQNSYTTSITVPVMSMTGSGNINFNSNIWGSQTTGIGANNGMIYINSNANVTITGNIYAQKGGLSSLLLWLGGSSNSAILTVNGNIIGSSFNSLSYPIYINSNATINVVGNLTSDLSPCIITPLFTTLTTYTCNISITGTITMTNVNSYPALWFNQLTHTLTINGSITNKGNTTAIVSPKIRFASTSTPYWIYQTNGASDMTLSYGTPATGAYPTEADVRFGTTYAASPTRTGTLRVPLPQYVSQGVLTDNTTGTAYINAADVWNILTSTITTAGSIGERLKVASTVETTGDQLAAYIV